MALKNKHSKDSVLTQALTILQSVNKTHQCQVMVKLASADEGINIFLSENDRAKWS